MAVKVSSTVMQLLYLLIPHLRYFIVLNRDSFIYRDDSLTSKRVIMQTKQPAKCFVSLQKLRVRLGHKTKLSPPVTDPPRRLFCCGSLLPAFSVRVLATFHLRCVYIILVWFGFLSSHLFGNSCSLG